MSFAPDTVADLRLAQLLSMLRYRRPFASVGEYEFREEFIAPLGPQDMAGNLVVRIPHPSGEHSRTLFSCHTDTVHRDDARQSIVYDASMSVIYKADQSPLGADDGAGCFVLLEMIRHGIPGTYVFHTGEEAGGVGSSLMAELEPGFLQQFDRAIAFDRRGTQDVITHQMSGRCCSTAFAQALADALNKAEGTFSYGPDSTGLFTDTANYTHLIPECTNVSVGYEGEHTSGEMLDVGHLMVLVEAVVKIDWDALPTERDPKAIEDDYGYADWKGWGGLSPIRGKSRRERKRERRLFLDTANALHELERVEPGTPDAWDVELTTGAARTGLTVPLFDGDDEEDEAENEQEQYDFALAMASDFFGACVDGRFDKSYHSLQMHEVVDFWLDNPRSFTHLLDAMTEHAIEDADIIAWVRGY
jgi:hypothetical protein